jgi:hypothetical protein
MVSARHHDPEELRTAYQGVGGLILSIDGLQPEKGHETLYVVREIGQKRVWFAEALLSSNTAEVRRLFERAQAMADALGVPVQCWVSDKQEAFVGGIAKVFSGVPHRYCANHFLRDLAKPMLEADSHAKVQMRKKVRGLRKIEQAVLAEHAAEIQHTTGAGPATEAPPAVAAPSPTAGGPPADAPAAVAPPASVAPAPVPAVSHVVLDYCAAVRGILNDNNGGPLHPPGERMAEALIEVREAIRQNPEAKKGGPRRPT